jgi:hypothetical protein
MPLFPALPVADVVAASVPVVSEPAVTAPSSATPTPSAVRPHLRAVRTPSPPVLDGELDDPVWKLAHATSSFRQKTPSDGSAATETTTVRVLYDDDAIYVAFDCPQPDTALAPHLTRRDRNVESDGVGFSLGTRGDHKSAFTFVVDPSGTLVDGIHFNDTDYSQDWDENWEARARMRPGGWSAEFRIPLRILRFPTRAVQSWDFQAFRYTSNKQEEDDWAYFPQTAGGEVSHYGALDDLRGLRERTEFELRPFVVGRVRRRDPAVGQLASGTDFLASGGLDAKWHPTQSLTLDATFDPDFAQVDADQIVLNVSTAETYYPERRPFFLEGIDALSTPFQVLYTRRIGQVPLLPALRLDAVNNEQLVDVPEPDAIYGAVKLSGRLSEHWSVGTVQAVTAPNSVQVQLGNGARVNRVIDPTTGFGVVRVSRDVGDNGHFALMATAVTHAESGADYPPLGGGQVLCPQPIALTPLQSTNVQVASGSRCFNDAYTAGTDWRWRSPSGDYTLGGQALASLLERGPPRPVADGTVLHPGDVGPALKAYLRKEGGEHWTWTLDTDLESRNFEINDLGYNARANQLAGDASLEYRKIKAWGPFTETHSSLYFGTQYNSAGLLLGQGTHLSNNARFKNKWWVGLDVYYRGNKYDDREVGDGTALRRDGALGTILDVTTDTTQRVSFSMDQTAEAIFDGYSVNGTATLGLRVLPQFDFDLLPSWQLAHGEPRYMMGGPAAGQYLFGTLDAKSVSLSLRTTYTFTPRLTLQGYAQLFLASGHYADYSEFQSSPTGPRPVVNLGALRPYDAALPYNPDFEQGILNVNVVLRWEYRLGSLLYVVYTRAQTPTIVLGTNDVGMLNLGAVGKAPASDALLLKASFWWGGG